MGMMERTRIHQSATRQQKHIKMVCSIYIKGSKYLSIYLSICLSVYLSIYLSIYRDLYSHSKAV